jgi:hypothetical protein
LYSQGSSAVTVLSGQLTAGQAGLYFARYTSIIYGKRSISTTTS